MALLTVALLFCVHIAAAENGEYTYRVAAPSLIRLCEDFKHKPVFCLICKGFDFSCFTSNAAQTTGLPTLSTPSTLPTRPSTASTTISTTPAMETPPPEPSE